MVFFLHDQQLLGDHPNIKARHAYGGKPCHSLKSFLPQLLQPVFRDGFKPHGLSEIFVDRFQTPVRYNVGVKVARVASRLPGLVIHERVG